MNRKIIIGIIILVIACAAYKYHTRVESSTVGDSVVIQATSTCSSIGCTCVNGTEDDNSLCASGNCTDGYCNCNTTGCQCATNSCCVSGMCNTSVQTTDADSDVSGQCISSCLTVGEVCFNPDLCCSGLTCLFTESSDYGNCTANATSCSTMPYGIGCPCLQPDECISADCSEGICICKELKCPCSSNETCNSGNCVDFICSHPVSNCEFCYNNGGCISDNCEEGICYPECPCGSSESCDTCLPCDSSCSSQDEKCSDTEFCCKDYYCDRTSGKCKIRS